MFPAIINKQFEDLLLKTKKARALRKEIGMSAKACCYLRWRLKNYNDVRLQTKMNWLQKAGYDLGYQQAYTRANLISFAKFCQLPSQKKGLSIGFEFLLTQWEARENKKRRKG